MYGPHSYFAAKSDLMLSDVLAMPQAKLVVHALGCTKLGAHLGKYTIHTLCEMYIQLKSNLRCSLLLFIAIATETLYSN